MHVKDYLLPFQHASFSGIDHYDYTLMHTPRHISLMLFMFTILFSGMSVSSWGLSSEEGLWKSRKSPILQVKKAEF